MKIGVVSDTHSQALPKQMLNDFKTVDFIIHAGDFCEKDDYEQLARIKEVKGVYGNMDGAAICKKFPRKQLITCGKVRIGVFHGEGAREAVLGRVQEEFKKEKVNAVVFGHSHHPLNERIKGVLYFNPGSPNDKVFAPYRSYGILEIDGEQIAGTIIKVKD